MPNDAAMRSMIETLITASDLTPYFHVEELPERLPVTVAVDEPGRFAGAAAFGRPIAFVEAGDGGETALSLRIDTDGGSGTRIEFTYPPEGVSGSAVFDGSASSKPTSVRIVER